MGQVMADGIGRATGTGSTASAIAYDGVWDQEDERERNKCLADMLDPKPPLIGDPFSDPAAGSFLCLPREVLQERLYNYYQTAAMIYGLIFSGVAGSALSPFDVAEYAEGSANRALANTYNLLASVQFMVCIICMWEATVIAIATCSESDLTIFRFAVHSSKIGWSLVVNTGYMVFLLAAQVSVVIIMKTDTVMAYIVVSFSIVWMVAKNSVFWPRFLNSAPGYVYPLFNNVIGPILRIGVFGPGKQAAKQKADRLGALKAEEAANNFGAHVLDAVRESLLSGGGGAAERKQEASPGRGLHATTDETDDLASEQGRLLSQFLTAALPQAQPERLNTLCVALIKADLDLHTLTVAARNPVVLDNALRDDTTRLNLRPGERLALVSSAGSRGESLAAQAKTHAAGVSISGGAFGADDLPVDPTRVTSPCWPRAFPKSDAARTVTPFYSFILFCSFFSCLFFSFLLFSVVLETLGGYTVTVAHTPHPAHTHTHTTPCTHITPTHTHRTHSHHTHSCASSVCCRPCDQQRICTMLTQMHGSQW